MTNGYETPIIPNEYVILKSRDIELRTLSVRKFRTRFSFDRQFIIESLERAGLVLGMEFGVVQIFDADNPDHTVRALCGLVGEKGVVLLDPSSHLQYLKLKNVLRATMMVEFLDNSEMDCLDLLIYGGQQGHKEFRQLLQQSFEIDEDPEPLKFSDIGVRYLCEKFFEYLYQIIFDPLNQQGWGTINAADFKSIRGRFIDPSVEQMQQVLENKDIVIQSFKSVLHNQRIKPLGDYYDVKFNLLKDRSGITITIPELTVPTSYGDVDYERLIYDFARYIYNQIIGNEDIYQPIEEDSQLSLFGNRL